MEENKKLVVQRAAIKSRLTRTRTFCESFDKQNGNISGINNRLSKIEECWKEFVSIQTEIDVIEGYNEEEWNNFETNYFEIKSLLESIIQSVSNTTVIKQSDFNSINNNAESTVKLPTIQLPMFSGAYEEFSSYFELFNSLIDANESIPNIQKFHYLRSSLKGEPAALISTLELSAVNYNVAIDLLKSRYLNKRIIINKHIQAITGLNKIENENCYKMRQFYDTTNRHLRALQALGQPIDKWDTLLIHLLTNKLDSNTRRLWETEISISTELPTFEQFSNFLNQRCKVLEACGSESNHSTSKTIVKHNPINKNNPRYYKTSSLTAVSNSMKCLFCKEAHISYKCQTFVNSSVSDRLKLVNKLNLCHNCLRNNHKTIECKSPHTCFNCKKRHHTMLHKDELSNLENNIEETPANSVSNHSYDGAASQAILLGTAVVDALNSSGQGFPCRILLDSGSQANFITESFVKALGLKTTKCNASISGIQGNNFKVLHSLNVNMQSRHNYFKTNLNFLVVPKITEDLPLYKINSNDWNIPSNVILADPKFNTPRKIDALIGAELFYELMLNQQVSLGDQYPTLQNTTFGWIVVGKIPNNKTKTSHHSVHNATTKLNSNLENLITKFWSLDEVENIKSLSTEEQQCEELFLKNHSHTTDGRFIVSYPFKENPSSLGQSMEIALSRFINLERRLDANPDLKSRYTEFLNDYLDQNHMEELSVEEENNGNPTYYMPHHPVIKESSSTTRLRVVFDASCKTSNNLSLNDILLVGPTIQRDLFSILLSFRMHRFVFIADIKQMYRQIRISSKDCDLQRILWRNNKSDPIKTYRLLTVTYGTSAAPYLAIRCLFQLSSNNFDKFPLATKILESDVYVDDIITGSDNLVTAKESQAELINLLKLGGFQLHKWTSNEPSLLEAIPRERQEINYSLLNEDSSTKALGLLWCPDVDVFKFKTPEFSNSTIITKRIILSEIAKLYDPLGLISPIIVTAKLLMQSLWQSKLEWDEPVETNIKNQWLQFRNSLSNLTDLSISRRITNLKNYKEIRLHGFCDSSERAYGCCLYVHTKDETGEEACHLLCSKSRIAPLKKQTLPRLELCGALILAKLTKGVLDILPTIFKSITLWTDSTVVLSWINAEPNSWKTFVGNRVADIQRNTERNWWKHVSSNFNPADLISRGCSPHKLLNNSLWWHGPSNILSDINYLYNECNFEISSETEDERKSTSMLAHVAVESRWESLIDKNSSYFKLVKITAYCLRFISNCRSKKNLKPKLSSYNLTVREWQNSEIALIKCVQYKHFYKELKLLQTRNELPSSNSLKSLNLFLKDNIIRVGGRITKCNVSYDMRHPILLPYDDNFTRLVVKEFHHKYMHPGPQLLLALLRQKYWPIRGKLITRRVFKNCLNCFKVNPKPTQQLMGNLPMERVNPTRVFNNCGVDFFGPILIKRVCQRKTTSTFKGYVALFICFVTRAIHLELVSDLTTKNFISTLKRFIARRGCPTNIFCDNGTTFVGASRELKRLQALVNHNNMNSFFIQNSINFHFIPPKAANFGGYWEAGVKTVKTHLKRVLGSSLLNFEELNSLLIEIEGCVNSRPLTPLSNDPHDPSPLTPAHFLIGDTLASVPDDDVLDINMNRLSRWQQVQKLKQEFWRRWTNEYLTTLNQRVKWTDSTPNLQKGDLVIVKEDYRPPLTWDMARIIELHPGADGKCRVVTVKTARGIFKRAISRICPLPKDNSTKK